MNGEKKIKLELDINDTLNHIRKFLLDTINYPFIFVYIDEDGEEEKELPENEELNKKLEDILDGKNLHIKKKIIIREKLVRKINSKGELDFYLYPKVELDSTDIECSSNIMVVGETGVGKSTWIHTFINYMQGIQIEENIRYLLFDEKEMQKNYEQKYGKKGEGSSVTDIPQVYNIQPSNLFSNPIRLIDTAGFGDTRGKQYDEK